MADYNLAQIFGSDRQCIIDLLDEYDFKARSSEIDDIFILLTVLIKRKLISEEEIKFVERNDFKDILRNEYSKCSNISLSFIRTIYKLGIKDNKDDSKKRNFDEHTDYMTGKEIKGEIYTIDNEEFSSSSIKTIL